MYQKSKRSLACRGILNKALSKRLNWEHIEKISGQEGREVLKGTNKRVVVIKSPDPKIFEQAIFILREDLISGRGEGGADVLRQAQKVADDYVKNYTSEKGSFLSRIPAAAFAGIGAAATAAAWIIMDLLA